MIPVIAIGVSYAILIATAPGFGLALVVAHIATMCAAAKFRP